MGNCVPAFGFMMDIGAHSSGKNEIPMRVSGYIKKMFLLIILSGVTFSLPAHEAKIQNSYYSEQLKMIAVQSGISEISDTLSDGIHSGILDYKHGPVIIVVENREVKHIGFKIFSAGQRKAFNTILCNFIERYTLSFSVPKVQRGLPQEVMKQDKVVLRTGNLEILAKLAEDSSVHVNYRYADKINFFTWEKDGNIVCELGFPSSYKLLLGMEMDELDARLKKDILKTPMPAPDSVRIFSKEDLVTSITRDYYVKKGSTYYFAELNSDNYYRPTGLNNNEYYLMYNSLYPRQSLANVMTAAGLPNDFLLNIKQEVYGKKDSLFVVPLEQYVSFCIKSGCAPYFCVINEDNGVMDCELIMRNDVLQYNHVMRLKIAVEDVRNRKGIINARLDAYVPMQYIKNVFNEIQL